MRDVFLEVRKQIVPVLLNTEINAELLGKVPHRDIYDMSQVYYLLEDDGMRAFENGDLEYYDVSEDQLYKDCCENAPHSRQAVLCSALYDAILTEDPELVKLQEEAAKDDGVIYTLSNSDRFYGSGVMLYPDTLENLKNGFGGGFYLMPLTIHDVLVFPLLRSEDVDAEMKDLLELYETTVVGKEDRLSERLFYYDDGGLQEVG